MPSTKEIRSLIKGIKNTQKITRAMQMVAASKMVKAQERVLQARPYAAKIREVIGHVLKAHPEFKHPFLAAKTDDQIKKVGVLVISTDKGLCGPLNTNAQRQMIALTKQYGQANLEIFAIGRRSALFARRLGLEEGAVRTEVPDSPELSDVIGVVTVALQALNEGRIDKLLLVYSEFVNTMSQVTRVETLVPAVFEATAQEGVWDYLYEPESKPVVEALVRRYIEAVVYHGLLENKASEQSARMVAMKNATENAKKLIFELTLSYNKARQAAITKELAEIAAGAEAV